MSNNSIPDLDLSAFGADCAEAEKMLLANAASNEEEIRQWAERNHLTDEQLQQIADELERSGEITER
jgi:hypothetical protein